MTHAITYLPQVDQVLVLQDGRLLDRGNYHNFVASAGELAQMVLQHHKDEDEETKDGTNSCLINFYDNNVIVNSNFSFI